MLVVKLSHHQSADLTTSCGIIRTKTMHQSFMVFVAQYFCAYSVSQIHIVWEPSGKGNPSQSVEEQKQMRLSVTKSKMKILELRKSFTCMGIFLQKAGALLFKMFFVCFHSSDSRCVSSSERSLLFLFRLSSLILFYY